MSLLKRVAYETCVATHQGQVRANNEDAVSVVVADAKEPWAWGVAIADGVGGGSAGEMASTTVVERLRERLAMWRANPSAPGAAWARTMRKHLTGIVDNLHTGLRAMAEKDPSLAGFSSTLVCLLAFRDRVAVIHCGDSRAYLYRDGWIHPLTRDHTWEEDQRRRGELSPEDIAASPNRAALMQSLGGSREVTPEISFHEIREGDVLLACSDGLTKYLSDADLGRELQANEDNEATANRLVTLACEAGGSDNVSVGVVRVRRIVGAPMPRGADELLDEPQEGVAVASGARRMPKPQAAMARPRRRMSRRRKALLLFVALAAVGAAGTSLSLWMMSRVPVAAAGTPLVAKGGSTGDGDNAAKEKKTDLHENLARRSSADDALGSSQNSGSASSRTERPEVNAGAVRALVAPPPEKKAPTKADTRRPDSIATAQAANEEELERKDRAKAEAEERARASDAQKEADRKARERAEATTRCVLREVERARVAVDAAESQLASARKDAGYSDRKGRDVVQKDSDWWAKKIKERTDQSLDVPQDWSRRHERILKVMDAYRTLESAKKMTANDFEARCNKLP